MTNKRMFSLDIVDSEQFYELPLMSQLLYFHLGMRADVKGFVQPKKIIRMVGLKLEDLRPLIEKNFVIPFESGVVVITHWRINNTPREDREAPTVFKKELSRISYADGVYTLLQDDSRSTPAEYSIVENSIDSIVELASNYDTFVDFFNKLTNRKFGKSDKKAERQYKFLIKEGYKKEDFEHVVYACLEDKHHKETNYKYMTPEFITRPTIFERYLNVQVLKKKDIIPENLSEEEIKNIFKNF